VNCEEVLKRERKVTASRARRERKEGGHFIRGTRGGGSKRRLDQGGAHKNEITKKDVWLGKRGGRGDLTSAKRVPNGLGKG